MRTTRIYWMIWHDGRGYWFDGRTRDEAIEKYRAFFKLKKLPRKLDIELVGPRPARTEMPDDA